MIVGDELRFQVGDVIVHGPKGCSRRDSPPAGLKARMPVQVIAASPAVGIAILISQVLSQLRAECPLDNSLLVDQPVLILTLSNPNDFDVQFFANHVRAI